LAGIKSGKYTWRDVSGPGTTSTSDDGGSPSTPTTPEFDHRTTLEKLVYGLRIPIQEFEDIETLEWESAKQYSESDIIVETDKEGNIVSVYKALESFFADQSIGEHIEDGDIALVGIPYKVPSSTRVFYDHPEYHTVAQALDHLLYVPPNVNLSNNVGTVEKGKEITSVTLSWNINKEVKSLELNQDIGSLDTDETSYTLDDISITSNTTFRVTVEDEKQSASNSTSIRFRDRRFWGVSPNSSFDFIPDSFNSQLSNSYRQSRTFDCSGGNYIYFIWPSSFGTPEEFDVGGFDAPFRVVNTIEHENEYGYTTEYDIYRSEEMQNSSSIPVSVS